jgi:endonuclease/exonuclease/phosphatase family metal-dependent hydrolase
MGMRLVSWNLGYWTPGRYSGIANRQEKWRFLLSLEPDVICVQECRPGDLQGIEGGSGYEIVGSIPPRWTACSAVVARSGLGLAAAPREGALFEALSGYVALATVTTGTGTLLIASVHTPAKVLDDPSVTDDDHRRLVRTGGERAYFNDVVFAALDSLPRETGFIFAGDWNTARLFDAKYPDGGAEGGVSSTEFFTRAAEHGWGEVMRGSYPEEVKTWLKPGQAPYQLDHVFADATNERLATARVSVLYEINGRDAAEFSDHAPVIADFDLSLPA